MQLRPYQQSAVDAVYDHLRTRDDHPCVVIPTAGGKSLVMASICRDAVQLWNGRVLVLAHIKELLEQTVSKLHAMSPDLRYGIYSAGLNQRCTHESVIVAGIQSVYRRAAELGAFDLVLIDECHLIGFDEDGMYRQLIAGLQQTNPLVRIMGFTATPFRLKSGPICSPAGILNHVCYQISVRELMAQGYLSKLITKAGTQKAAFDQLPVRSGEFVADEVEAVMSEERLVESACAEIVEYTQDRNAVLIFASGIKHGEHVVRMLASQQGIECGFVTGDTPASERDALLNRFRSDSLKYLCNVNVLTTGFDAPQIDCVALLRPTMSPGLVVQMIGRGFRLHRGKENCLILDFGGNILRHGPIDQLRITDSTSGTGPAPIKECPACHSLVATGFAHCPDCRHAFPPPQRQSIVPTATAARVVSGENADVEYEVRDVTYSVHIKRGAPAGAPRTMRVEYRLGLEHFQSEFICFEHEGYAQSKAYRWWQQRSNDPFPTSAAQAVDIAEAGGLALPLSITIRTTPGQRFGQVVGYRLGAKPDAVPAPLTWTDEEIPF